MLSIFRFLRIKNCVLIFIPFFFTSALAIDSTGTSTYAGSQQLTATGFQYNAGTSTASSITTVTGIRDGTITGNYSITNDSYSGSTWGLLTSPSSNLSQSLVSIFPSGYTAPAASAIASTTTTPQSNLTIGGNQVISLTPYGPAYGSSSGVLSVVGSYKDTVNTYTSAGKTIYGDQGFLYDAAVGGQFTKLTIPVSVTLVNNTTNFVQNTIAHSHYGNQVVGNYDTTLANGNAFSYNTATGIYTSLNKPSALSTTAYGVYGGVSGNVIAGGYANVVTSKLNGTGTVGYIYNQQGTGDYVTYVAPVSSGAPSGTTTVATHFEGITGAGATKTYNLVADSVDSNGNVHAWVVHVAADGTSTWTEITAPASAPGALVSANSIYKDQFIGVYEYNGIVYAYDPTVPGIYTPTTNSAPLTNNSNSATAYTLNNGDDFINTSTILMTGTNSQGVSAVGNNEVTNAAAGVISVTGAGSAAIKITGINNTVLNYGTLNAASGSYVIQQTDASTGTIVINKSTGVINGQVSILGDSTTRFENNGYFGITASGSGATHAVSGVFAQTSTGTLGLRVSPASADKLAVTGTAKLGGSLYVTGASGTYSNTRYTLLSTTAGISGSFAGYSTNLSNATNLFYDANNVYLNIYQFTTANTQQSLVNTANALQGTFALQNSVLVNSFSYDCNEFGENGICISVGGRNTAIANTNGLNNSSALLIAAYRANNNVRVGAYFDQNLSSSNPGGTVQLGNNTPLMGAFVAIAQRTDGTGAEAKLTAAYGQKNATITRQVVNNTEPGSGSSTLFSSGVQLVGKYGFAIMDKTIVAPYLGMRYTANSMGGYTEGSSASVTAPLTYQALNTNASTVVGGLGASHQLTPKTTLFGSAGLEQDISTSNGTYSASGINGLTPFGFNSNPVFTRATASLGASYLLEKNQSVSIVGAYRQAAYQSLNSTTGMLYYTIGL
jgi:hypothetical protein